jgi:hypothetical protein
VNIGDRTVHFIGLPFRESQIDVVEQEASKTGFLMKEVRFARGLVNSLLVWKWRLETQCQGAETFSSFE